MKTRWIAMFCKHDGEIINEAIGGFYESIDIVYSYLMKIEPIERENVIFLHYAI
jgi:hypothetical protein